VVVGVVADEVTGRRDPPRDLRIRLDPAALDEERRPDIGVGQRVEDSLRDAGKRRSVGMLRVERECDAEGSYRSTPVMTMPRTKKRWKMRNRRTGMIIVIKVPAWMSPGSIAIRAPLNDASPTGSVTRSGVVDR
jgi:hypothetical protein